MIIDVGERALCSDLTMSLLMKVLVILCFFLAQFAGGTESANTSEKFIKLNISGLKRIYKRSTIALRGGTTLNNLVDPRFTQKPDNEGYLYIEWSLEGFKIIDEIIITGELPENYDYGVAKRALQYFGLNEYIPKLTRPRVLESVEIEFANWQGNRIARVVQSFSNGQKDKGPWFYFNHTFKYPLYLNPFEIKDMKQVIEKGDSYGGEYGFVELPSPKFNTTK